MADTPRLGDAFGELMRAALAEQDVAGRAGARAAGGRRTIEIVERDDGMVAGGPAARWLAPPSEWLPCERRAVDQLDGRVLDIGMGAGRLALFLQERGVAVTGLDISAGAVEVARARGVADAVCATVADHVAASGGYDTFALFGNNLALLESRDQAPRLLAAIAAMARPGARIVGQGTDPFATKDSVHLTYQERNLTRGRMAGQMRMRVRYRDIATPWFDYLHCSPAELEEMITGTGWKLSDLDNEEGPSYTAVLRLIP